MNTYLIEKKFESDEKKEVFYVDALDTDKMMMYRFLFSPTDKPEPCGLIIDVLNETTQLNDYFIFKGDFEDLQGEINKMSKSSITELFNDYKQKIEAIQSEKDKKNEEEQEELEQGFFVMESDIP